MNLKTKIATDTTTLAKAEKSVKALVGSLSRDLLQYVVLDKTGDVPAVNRFIDCLTPANRDLAILFFKTFLPYKAELDEAGEFVRFGAKVKPQDADKTLLCAVFLADDDTNNLWTWAAANVEKPQKKVDYVQRVQKSVVAAIKHDTDKADIIRAVLDGGLTAAELVDILGELVQPLAEAA